MAFCGKCGTQINDGVRFCPGCGAALAIRLALKLPRGQVCPGKHLPVLSLQHDFLALAYRSQPSGEHQTVASIDVERLRCPGAGLLDSQNHTFPPYAPGPGVICAVP